MPHGHILTTCQVRSARPWEISQRYVSGVFVTRNVSLTRPCRCCDPRVAACPPGSCEQLLARAAGLHHFELTCLHFTFCLPSAGLSPVFHILSVLVDAGLCPQQRARLGCELVLIFRTSAPEDHDFPDIFRCFLCSGLQIQFVQSSCIFLGAHLCSWVTCCFHK